PLDSTMFWYADIGMGWQGNTDICDDNVIRISASSMDYYKVDDDGPWINADGDPDAAVPSDYPCPSGCKVGQAILRFRNYDGTIDIVEPLGTGKVFRLPDHGTIWVRINDISPANNVWKVEAGLQHHAGVSYMGAD
ncbi:MAG: hypothetical protein KC656_14680, partial [Myxococcales bacterium]|nr:hypothetical protein [Myxococcales bacterium]